MDTTKVFSKNIKEYRRPEIRTIANKGGTRSSKTWSILQLLYIIASKSKRPRLISIVSETMPHLKRGCIRDFEKMLKDDGLYNADAWNATDKIYKIGNSAIEFFSADQPSKVQGPARDILYINEAIYIPYEIYRQLATRTTEKIILDYNPTHESWIDTKILPRKDSVMIHSTYKDNDMLTPGQVKEIEYNGQIDPNYQKVFVEGLTGSLQGLVITNWDIVDEMPEDFKREWIGIDFGFTDPTAIMHLRQQGGEIYIDEIAYQSGLDNLEIAEIIFNAGLSHIRIIADSAQPASIKELRKAGLNIEGAIKGPDSIKLGIQVMNRYKKHYTERSINSIKENRMYRYKQDPNGEFMATPIDGQFNHAKDAERYVFINALSDVRGGFDVTVGSAGRQ